jgi:membrane-bound lytic murein transglycosylase D
MKNIPDKYKRFSFFSLLLLFAFFALSALFMPSQKGIDDIYGQILQYTRIVTGTELFVVADSIVSNAEKFTLDGNYSRAQNSIRIFSEIFSMRKESNYDTDSLLQRVASLYVEKLPPNYIDSVPIPIMPFVARYQFKLFMSKIDTANINMSKFPADCLQDVLFNVPITYNKRVEEEMNFLLTVLKVKRITRDLNRSLYYRPFMAKMYEKAGLPTDITYLPLIESAFDPYAYSVSDASGFWQFIPSTGILFGLRENYWADERRDPIKSTAASIDYLQSLYDIFGDWYLAFASYNFGEGRIYKQLQKAKEVKPDSVLNYWDLQLPEETMKYVPRYIAFKIIAKKPSCFGYSIDTAIVPFPYDTVKVSDYMDMARIAEGIGIPADSLLKMNPHIKNGYTPPDMKDVNLYIPIGTKELYYEFYAKLKPEDKVKLYRYEITNEGNIDSIATMFGTTVQAIKDANQMKSNSLTGWKIINIPLPDSETKIKWHRYKIAKGDDINSIAEKFGITVQVIKDMNRMKRHNSLMIGGYILIPLPDDEASAENIIKIIKTGEEIKETATIPEPSGK